MDPVPQIVMENHSENGKDFIVLKVPGGQQTPYYYVDNGNRIAYVRVGNESIPADAAALRRLESEKVSFEPKKVSFEPGKGAFERRLSSMKISAPTRGKAVSLFDICGMERVFSRADISKMFDVTPSSAGKFLNRLKVLGLIEPVKGQGKGKYRFVSFSE